MIPLVPSSTNSFTAPHVSAGVSRVAIFGSTGSIGVTSLEVLEHLGDTHVVRALFANSSIDRFVEQVLRYKPAFAGLADERANLEVRERLKGNFDGKWLAPDEIAPFSESDEYDLHLGAVIGVEGIQTTLPAYRSGKVVLLANKESLVVGGHLFAAEEEATGTIIPVDSEHSSLFRLLNQLENKADVHQYILTASGGPFLRHTEEQLKSVTIQDALKHPTWNMGTRITLDSATMVNKAFELIEAKWLFGCDANELDVVIHPQSIVHGILRLSDGTEISHSAPTSMSFPIAYALTYPKAKQIFDTEKLTPMGAPSTLEFLPADRERFPALEIGLEAAASSPGYPLRFYISNEVAAAAFLQGEMPFFQVVPFLQQSLIDGPLAHHFTVSELPNIIEEERGKVRELLSQFLRGIDNS